MKGESIARVRRQQATRSDNQLKMEKFKREMDSLRYLVSSFNRDELAKDYEASNLYMVQRNKILKPWWKKLL